MRGKDKVKIYVLLSLILMLFFIIPEKLSYIPIEYIYPGHAVFYLFKYSLTYPNSNPLRKLIVTFCLSMVELYLSSLICKIPISSLCKTGATEFLVIYLICFLMPRESIRDTFRNNEIRLLIFLNAAFWRSYILVSVVKHVLFTIGASQHSLVLSVFYGVLLMVAPSLISFSDNYISISAPKRDISFKNCLTYFKHGLLLSILCYILLISGRISHYSSVISDLSRDVLALQVCNIYLMIWYTLEAL